MSSQDHLFLSALEVFRPLVGAAVAQILSADPQIGKRLASMEGKLLAVEITELPYFFLWVNEGQAQLLWETSERPDGIIRAGLFATVQAKARQNGDLLHDGKTCEVLGDPDTVRAVRKFFSEFEPDWEERLAGIMGDTVAHRAGQSFRVAAAWTRDANRSAVQNFTEYLQEELQVLVTRPRVDRHLDELAQLQRDVNALAMRLTLLGCLAE